MKRASITIKLILLVMITFFASFISVVLIVNAGFSTLIDSNLDQVYSEKTKSILKQLEDTQKKLLKTGIPVHYAESFKSHTLTNLSSAYYSDSLTSSFPIIIDTTGSILLHPSMPKEELFFETGGVQEFLKNNPKSYFTLSEGDKINWYTFRYFEPWGWYILYVTPIDLKYAEANEFRFDLLFSLILIATVSIIIFGYLIRKFTKPIIALTKATSSISQGNLSTEISTQNQDEIGILARSIKTMQSSIRGQFLDLQDLKQHLSDIFDSMPSMLIDVDMDGKIYQWNSQAEKSSQIKSEDAIGKNIQDILPRLKDDLPKIKFSLQNNEQYSEKRTIGLLKSEKIVEQLTIFPLHSGQNTRAVIRLDDITEQSELEEQLKQSQKMDAIGQMTGGIAHDFNNLLGGILGSLELLKETELNWNEEALEYLDMSQTAALSASDLVSKLMIFSRKNKDISSIVHLHEIIEDSITILKRSIDKKIKITTSYKADIDSCIGDNSQLQNMIINMCINSSHAMPEGGEIQISTSEEFLNNDFCAASQFELNPGKHIRINIKDTGIGIHDENLHKIFEPFFTTKAPGKGTGLGLSAVYGIIKNHHGCIDVVSTVGEGTKFSLFLPLSEESENILSQKKLDKPIAGTGSILIIDDEDYIRKTTSRMLNQLGYSTTVAENGSTGLNHVLNSNTQFDVIILDMIMPDKSGKEVFEEIRSKLPNQKVIIASGFSRGDDLSQLWEQGLNDLIRKPFTKESLSRVVNKVLKS